MYRPGSIGFSILLVGALPCALSLHAQADHWQSLADSGNEALRKREFVTAGKLFTQALKEAKRSGLSDPRIAKSFKFLGDLYFAQQKYDQAKVYYSRSEAAESTSRNLLAAEQSLEVGAYESAKQAAELGLRQIEAKVGRQDTLVTPCLIVLARANKALLKMAEAEELLNRALGILDRPGEESLELASALGLLGTVYDEQGKNVEASSLLERALALRRKILPPDDPKLAESCTDLAAFYRRNGRAAEADPLMQQAAAIREKNLFRFKDYADKENGFHLQVPDAWKSIAATGIPAPGGVAAFQSPDSLWVVMVQRVPVAPGMEASNIFGTIGGMAESLGKGEIIGEENVELSGLPARRKIVAMPFGKVRLRDWMTFLVTRNQVWILHVIGPEAALSSAEAPEYRAAQKISDSFVFSEPVLAVLRIQVVTPPPPVKTITVDAANRRYYLNREVGLKIFLPEGWKESAENTPSFQEGKTVALNQSGTLAFVILGHDYLEASAELYLKVLTGGMLGGTQNFRQLSKGRVTLGGLEGMRVVVFSTENGIEYRSTLETFSAGKDHYRILARAPSEVYDRYAETMNQMLESIQFLPLESQAPHSLGSTGHSLDALHP